MGAGRIVQPFVLLAWDEKFNSMDLVIYLHGVWILIPWIGGRDSMDSESAGLQYFSCRLIVLGL